MALSSYAFGSEVGLRLLLSPATSNVIVRTACTAVGVGFPVYATFKSIEQKDHADQEQWLVYWTVYGCFSVAEIFSDKLLSWVPFYHHAKFIILVWLQIPNNYGARHLFMRYLRPLFLKHQSMLDRFVDGTRNEMSNFIVSHQGEIQAVKQTLQKLLTANVMGSPKNSEKIETHGNGDADISGKDKGKSTPPDGDKNPQTAQISRRPDDEPEWIDVFREDT
ncbi:hypothetical protein O6H91_01G094700 [Diphasiastrum complanatum]|uniref:Uncharacterized protein n=1 Tax=Diphasiastrum complanatum TaxID=34168 RepID=A0ACC2ETJ2_DIPCM|nr:hypothetical protein O6H91_01G094700 [Diphasiastrum complanatum]